jgi:hypothetical protein
MPTILAANESTVQVNGKPVEGVRSIEYRKRTERSSVYGFGSAERMALTSGGQTIEGRLTIASAAAGLDAIEGEASFQISALLRHGNTTMTVSFDDCYLVEKSFALGVGGYGEAVYGFTATRVREQLTTATA